MNKFRFIPVEQNLFCDELGYYRTYGIRAEELIASEWVESMFLSDVSCDAALVAELSARFTAFQLDPCQLKDAVLDTI